MFLYYCINAISSFFLKAKAEEELQETQSQINLLLNELSSLSQTDSSVIVPGVGSDFVDAASSPPEDAVASHTETLHVRLLVTLR